MAGGYCQIYCQIGGFEGIAGDKFVFEVSKLLISLMPPPSSNPSLSANFILKYQYFTRFVAVIFTNLRSHGLSSDLTSSREVSPFIDACFVRGPIKD
jgi:hypothetical protein